MSRVRSHASLAPRGGHPPARNPPRVVVDDDAVVVDVDAPDVDAVDVGAESRARGGPLPKRASGRQNTKRAWRKNEGAEDVTSEWLASKEAEPQGPAYAERSDAEIFVVDTAPLASAAEAEKKPNFLDQILANDSAVTAVGRRATENNLKQGILPVSAVRVEGAKHLASKAELHKIEQRVKRAKKMTEAEKKGIEKARIARLHAHKKEVKSAKAACPSYDLWGTPKTHTA
ncbi:hypothetical protein CAUPRSCDRAFT_13266, partial [Caulochytrium protostelioides]